MKILAAVAVISLTFSVSLIGQDVPPASKDSTRAANLYRDPQRAKALASVLPGAGYVYTGDYLLGYATWAGTATSLIAGPVIYQFDGCVSIDFTRACKPPPRWTYQAVGILLIGVGAWIWVSSVRDAPHAAERATTRHQLKLSEPPPPRDSLPGPRLSGKMKLH